MASSARVPELDGIRGMAILLILVYHWVVLESTTLPERLSVLGSFGWSGVDLFFVLSGFLIGGILLDAKSSSNYFRVFYVRRFLRILPLYFLVCLISVAVFYSHLSTHAWLFEEKIPWYAYLTFAQNYWMAKYNAFASRQLDATWSLAIEEQFYLTLPLVISLTRITRLPYILLGGIILAPLLRISLWFSVDPAHQVAATYLLAPCRMDALLLGVLAAWWIRYRNFDLVRYRSALMISSVVLGFGFGLIMHYRWNFGSFQLTFFGYTWIALFYLSLLLLAVSHKGFVSRGFSFGPLKALGIVAYGLYLFHQPTLGLVYGLLGKPTPRLSGHYEMIVTGLSTILLLLLAYVSWIYFEKPLVRIGHRFKYSTEHPVSEKNRLKSYGKKDEQSSLSS